MPAQRSIVSMKDRLLTARAVRATVVIAGLASGCHLFLTVAVGALLLGLLVFLGIALPAVWSSRPARRKAAAAVLAQILAALQRHRRLCRRSQLPRWPRLTERLQLGDRRRGTYPESLMTGHGLALPKGIRISMAGIQAQSFCFHALISSGHSIGQSAKRLASRSIEASVAALPVSVVMPWASAVGSSKRLVELAMTTPGPG